MQTPDLAGLLGKPARRPRPDPNPSQAAVDDAPVGENGQDPQVIEEDTPELAPTIRSDPSPTPTAAPSTRPKRSAIPRRPEPKTAAAVTANTGTAPSGRQYLRTIALYIPRSLHRRLGERADASGTTRTALILTAVNERHHDLPAALDTSTTTAAGDLFDIPQQRAEKEPSVHTTIRVTDRQLTAIDHLVQELETNRSALIAAALRLHLN